MEEYRDLVADVLAEGHHKPNRTGVDTISAFGQYLEVDLQEGFPLLTTKRMDGFCWNSLIHELIWYFSDEAHIRTLREETGIWDDWADPRSMVRLNSDRSTRRGPTGSTQPVEVGHERLEHLAGNVGHHDDTKLARPGP